MKNYFNCETSFNFEESRRFFYEKIRESSFRLRRVMNFYRKKSFLKHNTYIHTYIHTCVCHIYIYIYIYIYIIYINIFVFQKQFLLHKNSFPAANETRI